MPDLSIEKLVFFLFAVVPGFIAMRVYALKCPPLRQEWGNSLIEAVTYSLVNLTLWLWWIVPIVQTPFAKINPFELAAAIACVCFASPVALALGWYKLRPSWLHKYWQMDHPTPRGWDHFTRENHEYWVIFHWKKGGMSGGFFGEHSYASTFPQEPEVYVEEMWRVDDRGVFLEVVENTLGGVVRLSECERVEFLTVQRKGVGNGAEEVGATEVGRGPTGKEYVEAGTKRDDGPDGDR